MKWSENLNGLMLVALPGFGFLFPFVYLPFVSSSSGGSGKTTKERTFLPESSVPGGRHKGKIWRIFEQQRQRMESIKIVQWRGKRVNFCPLTVMMTIMIGIVVGTCVVVEVMMVVVVQVLRVMIAVKKR